MTMQDQKLKEIDDILESLKMLVTRTLMLKGEQVPPAMPTNGVLSGLRGAAKPDDTRRLNSEMFWDGYRNVRKNLGNNCKPRAVVSALAKELFGQPATEKTLTVKTSQLKRALMHLYPEHAIRDPNRALTNFCREIGLH